MLKRNSKWIRCLCNKEFHTDQIYQHKEDCKIFKKGKLMEDETVTPEVAPDVAPATPEVQEAPVPEAVV